MFGFFDKKAREERKKLDKIRDMFVSAPPSVRRTGLSKMAMSVIQQFWTLRDAGNSSDAEKHILKGVDVIRDIFERTEDPSDFRMMCLPLRFAGMPVNVMNGAMAVVKDYPHLDHTLIFFELGLAMHQHQRPYDEVIKVFEKAIFCTPTPRTKHCATIDDRAQIAFCAWTIADHASKDADVQRFKSLLAEYMPQEDWASEQQIRKFAKSTGGFVDGKLPLLGMRQNNVTSKVIENKKIEGKKIYYRSIRLKQGGNPQDLASWLIVGDAWTEPDGAGGVKYESKFYAGSDMITVLEIEAARYWISAFEKDEPSYQQVVKWIADLQQKTGIKYLGKYPESEETMESTLSSSVMLSVTYIISDIDAYNISTIIKPLLKLDYKEGGSHGLHKMIRLAEDFRRLGAAGKCDLNLMQHISKSAESCPRRNT